MLLHTRRFLSSSLPNERRNFLSWLSRCMYVSGKLPATCYYKTLNVPADSSLDDIKHSFLTMAKIYHPDINQGNPVQESKFKEVLEAYTVLSNVDHRKQYDKDTGLRSESWLSKMPKAITPASSSTAMNVPPQNATIDEKELFNYFSSKYFQNPDYYNTRDKTDNPYVLTDKLFAQYRTKMDERMNSNKYQIYHNFTHQAYWDETETPDSRRPSRAFWLAVYDFRILLGLIATFSVVGFTYHQINKKDKKEVAGTTKGQRIQGATGGGR